MASMTPERTAEFLAGTSLAHFITTRKDGSPHSVPVWYEFADDRFYVFTPSTSLKLRNLARDPRMVLSIASETRPYEYVVASGAAEVFTGDVDVTERAQSIAGRYEGPEGGVAYIEKLRTRFDVTLVAMTPTRLTAWSANS